MSETTEQTTNNEKQNEQIVKNELPSDQYIEDTAKKCFEHIRAYISDPGSIDDYIRTKDIDSMLKGLRADIECFERIYAKMEEDIERYPEYDPDCLSCVVDIGLDIVCMYGRMLIDIKKAKDEIKKRQDEVIEKAFVRDAEQIFRLLKPEVLQEWETFDEWSIGMYVRDVLALARKHNIDLGVSIDVNEDVKVVEEIPTTYATELEAIEPK